MGVKVRFSCDHCDACPDGVTQRTLERHLRDRTVGRFFDAQPGNWLIWTAGGPFGSRRYACPEHRDALIAYLRRHHGGRGSGAWASEPFVALWPHGFTGLDEGEIAELLGGTRRDPADAPPPRRSASNR
jgi:hypothetical protein